MSLTIEKDRRDVAINLARELLKKFDFNEGQRSISNSANIYATVIVRTDYEYAGTIGNIESEIIEYRFEINASHPEAISEAIDKVTDTVKDTMESIYNYSDTWPIGDGAEATVERNESVDGVYSRLGLFV